MMFGQLYGCERLRELVSVISAHSRKAYHLGFGKEEIKLANLAKANANRDYRIFEEFARKLIEIAQNKRIDAPFDLNGKFYAFDSTTIDLCLNLFWWAKFRSTKSGIKAHTLFNVVTQIPAYINITNANVHDTQAMDDIPYEPNAYYIFDRGYFDLVRLYKINIIDSFFIIRQKGRLQYKIVDGEDLVEGDDGVISDQIIELTVYQSKKKYPGILRRIVYYSKELKRTFVYITNAFYINARDIAMLYKKRWQVELFLNGSSSICTSNPFGATLKTQSEYKFTVPYPLTVLLLSPNMTGVSTGACSMYSASCEALSLTKRLSENCSKDRSTKDLKYTRTSAFNLALILVDTNGVH